MTDTLISFLKHVEIYTRHDIVATFTGAFPETVLVSRMHHMVPKMVVVVITGLGEDSITLMGEAVTYKRKVSRGHKEWTWHGWPGHWDDGSGVNPGPEWFNDIHARAAESIKVA